MSIPAIAPDEIDLQVLEAFLETRAWSLYKAKLAAMIAEHARVCLDSNEPESKIRASQGAVAALQRVLELPKILKEEIRGRHVKERNGT